MTAPYLMASDAEARRLEAQEAANPSRARLLRTGLGSGQRALDVGCGAGEVTRAMAALVAPGGQVTGVEPVAELLAAARAGLGALPAVQLVQAALPTLPLPGDTFDYVFSQYVFEYLREPAAALAELVRVTRPGGKVVVADIDGHGLGYWPAPPVVEAGKATFLAALERAGFDLFAGRKVFALFRAAGLREVRVHVDPFYVVAGAADERLLEDWRVRFRVLEPVAGPAFGAAGAYRAFTEGYLSLLASPDALKYALVLTTEGLR